MGVNPNRWDALSNAGRRRKRGRVEGTKRKRTGERPDTGTDRVLVSLSNLCVDKIGSSHRGSGTLGKLIVGRGKRLEKNIKGESHRLMLGDENIVILIGRHQPLYSGEKNRSS